MGLTNEIEPKPDEEKKKSPFLNADIDAVNKIKNPRVLRIIDGDGTPVGRIIGDADAGEIKPGTSV